MDPNPGVSFCSAGETSVKNIDPWVYAAVVSNRCPDKRQPHKKGASQLFRPKERMIENIATKDLNNDDNRHRQAKNEQAALRVFVA